MKRNKDIRLTPAERRSLYFLAAVLLAVFGLGWWLVQFKTVPPNEIAVRSGEDLRVPVAELGTGTGKARIFRIEGQEGGPVRVFVKRPDHGRMVVTFAACRRCDKASRRSRVSDGQIICGHCGEPMPTYRVSSAVKVARLNSGVLHTVVSPPRNSMSVERSAQEVHHAVLVSTRPLILPFLVSDMQLLEL